MRTSSLRRALILVFVLAGGSTAMLGQPSTPEQKPSAPEQKKPPVETPTQRLAAAKTVMVVYARGNPIPFDVIKSTLEGWIRISVVEAPEKADLIVEVATSGGNSDTRVTGSNGPSMLAGRPDRSSSSSTEFSNADITMTVYDAKNRRVLWSGTETAKSALKQTTRENKMVEAAEKLASRFHDRLEPPLPKGQE
jgi:hypothetical protein